MPRIKWQRTRNIVTFPYGWQRPAKTEEWAYERCLEGFPENKFIQLLCFPWATLIDLSRKGKTVAAKEYETALRCAPPRTTLIRATVCQHIYAKDMLPWFKQLKITDLFWVHSTLSETSMDGIRIHPFPLYPACGPKDPDYQTRSIPLLQRKYLYSFVGAYEPVLYISDSRERIFNLPKRADAYIERRSDWHFDKAVYGEQIGGVPLSDSEKLIQLEREQQYQEVLSQSIFSLCPSGSGPNSIRLWESLEFGCIPVVLSDTLRLPGEQDLWRKAAVFVPETAIAMAKLPAQLEALRSEPCRLEKMQQAGDQLRRNFGRDGCIAKYISEVCTQELYKLLE